MAKLVCQHAQEEQHDEGKFVPCRRGAADNVSRYVRGARPPLRDPLGGRNYVTLREEDHNGQTEWVETSVGRARLASAPARITHIGSDYWIVGAAWGAPIDPVEVKIDDGPWMPATIDHSEEAKFAWKIWSLDWPNPPAGEHTVTSRAIDTSGNVQPAMNDPWIAKKHTYWESNGQVTRRVQIG